jgi:hypothetical protein
VLQPANRSHQLLLPTSKSIFTILDNISDYQSSLHDYSQPTLHILQYLHRLADERRSGPRLKVLLTSANRTSAVPYIVNQVGGEYVALYTSAVGGRGGSMRGRPFENDIRMVMQSPLDTTFLDPSDQRSRMFLGGEMGRRDVSTERPRSVGRYM